jgi:hypothetical protein
MKLMISAVSLALMAAFTPASAADDHTMLTPQDVKWGPGPASLPKGAESAVLMGDPTKEGMFALRLKFPKGFAVAPPRPPKPEIVTVISGTSLIGMGETTKAQALPAGSFFAFAPGMAHSAYTDEETVVQTNSTGPWGVEYINPTDDPRQKTQ